MNEETTTLSPEALNRVFISGDLQSLSDEEKAAYYERFCDAVGVNPLTLPFGYVWIDGKQVLYALKDCFVQLREKYGVVAKIKKVKAEDGVAVVVASAESEMLKRYEESVGAVAMNGKKANAFMAAETKAKRRATLNVCGISLLCEMEVEEIRGSHKQGPTEEAKPDKATPDEIPAPISATNWMHLISWIGSPSGAFYGKKMGELLGPGVEKREENLLHFENVVLPKLGHCEESIQYDNQVIESVEFARTAFNLDKEKETNVP